MFRSLPKPLKRIHWGYRSLLWQIHRQLRESVTLKTQQGVFRLPLDAGDAIARHLYSRLEFELEWVTDSLSLLRAHDLCPPKGQGTVLDVGANNGVISIGMLANGEFAKAIAVEPDPSNFSLLEENVAANGFEDRFTCLNYAASDRRCELAFELSDSNHGDHRVRLQHSPNARELFNESERRVIQVPADSVDQLLEGVAAASARQVSLVWIDVQGHEGYVFRGAANLLAQGIPTVAEVWPYGLERSGMSQETYCKIASEIWSTFWTSRRGRLVAQPVDQLGGFVARLGRGVKHANVIFTR